MLRLDKRGKKGIFHITGTLCGQRVRESTGTASEPHAQAKLNQRQSEILDRSMWGAERTATFAEAVEVYLNKRKGLVSANDATFISKLNAHFGCFRLRDVDELAVSAFCGIAYPRCTTASLNRQVYTPLIAIMNAGAKAKLCAPPFIERPTMAKRKVVSIPSDDVIAKLLPFGTERLQAALLFVTFTGARASECCRLTDENIDWERGEALLDKTKNGDPRVVPLPGVLFEALLKLRGHPGPIFGFKQRGSLNQAIARACRRAGLPKLTSHKLGRHAFARRLLAQGHTLKEVQEAVGWKSYQSVDPYSHLERSAVHEAMRRADTDFARLIDTSRNVVRIQRAKN